MRDIYDSYEDKVLLELISRGNRRAFTSLFYRYWKDLYRGAYSVTKDQALSMDVVQEVFVWFWENRERWEVTNTRSYLQAAVKYKIANAIRKDRLRSVAFEGWKDQVKDRQVTIIRDLEVQELRQVIIDFVGQLPERCQEIFHMSRFDHMSNKEIATKLNISEKTVENQITIALRRLRKHLGRLAFWMVFFL